MDAFTTEIGTEAVFQANGFLGVVALTNGEIRGNIKDPQKRAPALMLKGGWDRQLSEDLRVRITASYRSQSSAISNTLYSGDRAGSRYYFALENTNATESANFTSGRVNPGFTDELTAFMVNPFIKWRGLEFFGMYESASGRGQEAGTPLTAPPMRDVTQMMAELVYRFGVGEKFYVGARWNTVEGQIGQSVGGAVPSTSFNYFNAADAATYLATEPTITRTNIGAGWFITPSLMLKGEFVTQTFEGFRSTDIRRGGKFNGFMIEAITAF
jgi:hypothetical protein